MEVEIDEYLGKYNYAKYLLNIAPCYDVWRIDTNLINNKWHVDPNLSEEQCKFHNSLYTEFTIAPYALKLFSININDCKNSKLEFTLEPVKNINDYINLKHRLQHVRVK